MLRNLFHRHEDSHTLLQSTDATTSSAAQAQEWAALGSIAAPAFGPAAQRYITPAGALSPVARKAVERITGNPIA
jgi:hypothetical protein